MGIEISQLKQLDEYRWLVPRAHKAGMRTDALIYADRALLEQIVRDLSIEQAMNVAFLPGIVGRSLAMPDIHQGYGFPIGGVAATDAARCSRSSRPPTRLSPTRRRSSTSSWSGVVATRSTWSPDATTGTPT